MPNQGAPIGFPSFIALPTTLPDAAAAPASPGRYKMTPSALRIITLPTLAASSPGQVYNFANLAAATNITIEPGTMGIDDTVATITLGFGATISLVRGTDVENSWYVFAN